MKKLTLSHATVAELQNIDGNKDVKEHILPYISPITARDHTLLKESVAQFRTKSINYEDSWGYIIQATRYKGFKWYDSKTGYLIFFGHRSRRDKTLVIPTFFCTPDYLASVLDKLHTAMHSTKTVLKNVNPADVALFIPHGFRPYKKREHWSSVSRFDDQTYPQLIIDLEKLSAAQGRAYHPLRKALNKVSNVILRKYSDSDRDAVLNILALKDSLRTSKYTHDHNMYYDSHEMYPASNTDKYVIVYQNTNEILGFTATSDISSAGVAFIASIFKPGQKHIGTWGMYRTLVVKYHEGFTIANMGGSETEPTFLFKQEKFQPIAQLEKNHLIYETLPQ